MNGGNVQNEEPRFIALKQVQKLVVDDRSVDVSSVEDNVDSKPKSSLKVLTSNL